MARRWLPIAVIALASVACADRGMRPADAPESSKESHVAATPSDSRGVDTALFVVGDPNAANESERLMADRLRQHHDLSVHLIDDDHVTVADADEVAVVLISKTGESEKTGAMFRDATTPVVFWEDNLQRSDFLGTSHDDGSQSTAWHGTEQRIDVEAAAGVARTGGLSGEIDLLTTGGQEIVHAPPGALVGDATVVAT